MKYFILTFLIITLPAIAGGRNDQPKNPPPSAKQAQAQLQGQAQGQGQHQSSKNLNAQQQSSDNKNLNANLNANSSRSSSSSHSGAISGAAAGAAAGSISHGGSSSAGGGSARSTSTTGPSTSQVGDTTAHGGVGEGGQSQASSDSGDHSSSVDVSFKENNDYPAAQAATVFAGYCQGGMSGQVEAGGFTVISNDQFCEYIRLAAVMREAFSWEMKNGSVACADEMSIVHSEGEYADLCINDKAQEYLDKYHWNLEQAYLLVKRTKETSLFDRIAGQLVRPVAVIAALVLLI